MVYDCSLLRKYVQRCRNIPSSRFYEVNTNWHPLDWARDPGGAQSFPSLVS